MGINATFLSRIKTVLEQQALRTKKRRLYSLGYPDLLVDIEHILKCFGSEIAQTLPIDERQRDIQLWHRFTLPVYDSIELFARLGFKTTVIDKIAHRGIECVVDLNEPLPEQYQQQASLLIDTGTLEHCFNVGTAFRNMCEMTQQGGVIITAAPANKFRHGYYNFGPDIYIDAFNDNGFEILDMVCLTSKMQPVIIPSKTKNGMPHGSIFMVTARRNKIQNWQWPVQRKYL